MRDGRTARSLNAVPSPLRIGWRRQWIPAHLRRRLLAALLAASAALLALTSVHHPAPPPPTSPRAASDPLIAGLGEGQVAAPVRLVDPGVAALLHSGSVVDVMAVASSADDPAGAAAQAPAKVIAHGVRVIAVPTRSGSATDGTTGGSLVVLRVDRQEAQAMAGAEAAGRLSVVLVAS